MEINKAIEVNPYTIEKKRITEIKSLSYLKRLMIIIEVSHTLRMVNGIQFEKKIKFLKLLNLHLK